MVASGGDFDFEDTTFFGLSSCDSPVTDPTDAPTPNPVVDPTDAPTPSPEGDGIWVQIFSENFENGFGEFTDGGSDAALNTNHFNDGATSLRIRDDTSSSRAYTGAYSVSSFNELRVSFAFKGLGMETGERFLLEHAINGASSFTPLQGFVAGSDFDNGDWNNVAIEFGASSMNDIRLQFRCDASVNNDRIFIDSVLFEGKA